MENKIMYFVLRNNGKITNIVKIENLSSAYKYENGKWVYNPNLIKIIYDNTDYEEITEKEAKELIAKGI